jgi:hypothetical protein
VPLLLWDIDGTLLLKASREHAEALRAGIQRVYHVELHHGEVEAAGRTDFAIARSILTLAGVSADRVDDEALRGADAVCSDVRGVLQEM